MVQTIQAQNVNIRDLIENFGLQLVEDEGFFSEWQENLPEVTETEKQLLDKVKRGFINLLNYPSLLENAIKMAVLDPILFIADFYLAPFYVKSEQSIEIVGEDEGVIIRGRSLKYICNPKSRGFVSSFTDFQTSQSNRNWLLNYSSQR